VCLGVRGPSVYQVTLTPSDKEGNRRCRHAASPPTVDPQTGPGTFDRVHSALGNLLNLLSLKVTLCAPAEGVTKSRFGVEETGAAKGVVKDAGRRRSL
jgi:hypothetical protein